MEEEKRKAYSEVVEILKLIEDEEKIEKIPFEVVELIKGNSDPTYKPQISTEIPLEEQNLREQTYVILGWIASKYWGENIMSAEPQEPQESQIQQEKGTIYNSQEDIKPLQEERVVRNSGVYNDIDPQILETEVPEGTGNLPILLSSLKWYQKIKVQIIKFLKIIYRGDKRETEGVN